MTMESGDPWWTIRLLDGNRLFCEAGSIIQISGESETSERSDEEKKVMDFANQCEERWGDPRIDPIAGECKKCQFFRFIDMDFMVGYGVCANADSGLDGRVVSVVSGCPSFQPWQIEA